MEEYFFYLLMYQTGKHILKYMYKQICILPVIFVNPLVFNKFFWVFPFNYCYEYLKMYFPNSCLAKITKCYATTPVYRNNFISRELQKQIASIQSNQPTYVEFYSLEMRDK